MFSTNRGARQLIPLANVAEILQNQSPVRCILVAKEARLPPDIQPGSPAPNLARLILQKSKIGKTNVGTICQIC